jgi:hypothetical protein
MVFISLAMAAREGGGVGEMVELGVRVSVGGMVSSSSEQAATAKSARAAIAASVRVIVCKTELTS